MNHHFLRIHVHLKVDELRKQLHLKIFDFIHKQQSIRHEFEYRSNPLMSNRIHMNGDTIINSKIIFLELIYQIC